MLPEDIEAKEFLISLRGYDKDEVQAFLRVVAEEYRAALSGVGPGPENFEALGQEVGNVLQVARESADAMLRDAQGRAGGLIAAAEADAEVVRSRLRQELASLEADGEVVRSRLRQEQATLESEVEATRSRLREEEDAVETAVREARERADVEARRHVQEVRAAAEREAARHTAAVAERVEQLKDTEAKMRQRLYALQVIVESLREDLEGAVRGTTDTSPTGDPTAPESEPPDAPAPPEPPDMTAPAPPETPPPAAAEEAGSNGPAEEAPGAPGDNGDATPAAGEEGTFLQRVMSSARRWSLL